MIALEKHWQSYARGASIGSVAPGASHSGKSLLRRTDQPTAMHKHNEYANRRFRIMIARYMWSKTENPILVLPHPKRDTIALEMSADVDALSDRNIDRLLGAIIVQARHDCMSAVEFEYHCSTATLSLRYYGPESSADARWWDMSPPLAQWYGKIFRRVIALTSFKMLVPLSGTIIVLSARTRLTASVLYNSLHRFRIAWGDVREASEGVRADP